MTTIEETLTKLSEMRLPSMVLAVRELTLTCFQCPSDGVAQPLDEAETNAPKPLLTCYNNAVDGLLFQYVFPMPARVEILDNQFSHGSK